MAHSDPPGGSQALFASELVKLLVQVAWADHEVAAGEEQALLAFARRSGLPEAELTSLQQMLEGKAPLQLPNLAVLKPRRTDVLRAIKELLQSDLEVADEEEDILTQIAALLD